METRSGKKMNRVKRLENSGFSGNLSQMAFQVQAASPEDGREVESARAQGWVALRSLALGWARCFNLHHCGTES